MAASREGLLARLLFCTAKHSLRLVFFRNQASQPYLASVILKNKLVILAAIIAKKKLGNDKI